MSPGAIATGGTPGLTQLLVAGIGEMVHSRDGRAILVAYGLGSCVALSAWDPVAHVGGLAHFMLPGGQVVGGGATPVKTVQGGLAPFLDAFIRLGGQLRRAELKAAGGAAMLSLNAGGLEIGRRNADAVIAGLDAQGLRLRAKDLGGSAGRTVQLEVGTGRLLVKSVSTITTL